MNAYRPSASETRAPGRSSRESRCRVTSIPSTSRGKPGSPSPSAQGLTVRIWELGLGGRGRRAAVGAGFGSLVTPRAFAKGSKVAPWSRVERRTAKKTMLKKSRLSEPLDHRKGGEDDRDRAAEPRPGQNGLLAKREPERQRRQEGRRRSRDEHQNERQQRPLQRDVSELRWEDEQAEDDEHRHLADLSETLVKEGHRGGFAGIGTVPRKRPAR